MRSFGKKLGLFFVLGTLIALLSVPAQAQTALCELDWNCDGAVTWSDVWEVFPGGVAQVKNRGFYADVYYYTVYHNTYPQYVDGGYFHQFYQCGVAGDLDWNGDGVIEMGDAYRGAAAMSNIDTFYTQWWVLDTYPTYYDYYYPSSDCGDSPPPTCIYHSDCAADEYCAGDGCQAPGDWYGPLPEGICTPKADPADCVGEMPVPVCACNNQLRLSMCELEANGERWASDGMCPQIQCPSGLDSDCPPAFVCHDGGGTVPNVCLPATE